MKIQAACMTKKMIDERKMTIVLRDTFLEENKSLVTEFVLGRLCLTGPGIHKNGNIRIWNTPQLYLRDFRDLYFILLYSKNSPAHLELYYLTGNAREHRVKARRCSCLDFWRL